MLKIVVGVDIGGTNTVFGFIDEDGNNLAHSSIPTKRYSIVSDYINELAKQIRALKNVLTEDIEIIGIGIGAPNANYYTGEIMYAANLPWKTVIPLAKMMKSHFNVPIVVTNDANAAAVGEMVFGGAKGMKDFIVITLGTGLGSGIISNGELVYGHNGFAGEVGHIEVAVGGRECGCGGKGCLETYVSASGVKRTVYKFLAEDMSDSELRIIPFHGLSAKMVSEAAQKGDVIAQKTFEHTGKMLGKALANVVAVTGPEAIFLFGGLAKAGDLLFEPVKRHFEENVLKYFKGMVKILPSALSSNAAILGASALIWKKLKIKLKHNWAMI